jgi:hypothetical protein
MSFTGLFMFRLLNYCKLFDKHLRSDLVERVVKPCCDRWRPRLDGDELAVRLVDRLAGLVEVPKIQEHLTDQFVLQSS